MVGEVGVASSNNFSALVWPAGAKATFEHKRQFAELSSAARLDSLLNEALQQTKLAYRFSPTFYTFEAMVAVLNAIAARVAPDWIQELTDWNDCGTGDVLTGPVGECTPGTTAD
jgi:hypothetical protein